MGLDMYLSKRTYIREADRKESRELLKILVKIFCPDNKLNINPERITYIEEKVGYWRKANQIHKWFVDNIQAGKDDCGYYPVTSENLESLLSLVERVLDDHTLAGNLLPTQRGTFFRYTEYDGWYFDDLKDTKKILTDLLKEPDIESTELQYHASW